ncbi:uncharacterized protein LOC120206915 [Hibiscus syriacus]|uniref:uncharacterized protein LOC120206915 n=1 Tax=Hibiscus syriacus TaxID=106335 RepID=UPI001921A5DD|nr:uncharacterized protein LOC120206915 [Hibiscus syriacus]
MLVLMILVMLWSTDRNCAADAVNKNKSISSRWCDGSSKEEECLKLQLSNDIETVEMLMDSEASKMVYEVSAASGFADSKYATIRSLDRAQAVCDRNTGISCTARGNSGTKVPPNCTPTSYNRECHRH